MCIVTEMGLLQLDHMFVGVKGANHLEACIPQLGECLNIPMLQYMCPWSACIVSVCVCVPHCSTS